MAPELPTGLPSVRYIQRLIKDQQAVEVKLMTNDSHIGKILWQDPQCLVLQDQSNQSIMLWWHGIASIKPKG